jgi:hypothetical protein
MNKNDGSIYKVGNACFDPEQAVSWQKTKPNDTGVAWSEIYLSTGHTMTIEDDGEAFEFVSKVRMPKDVTEYTSADLAEKLKALSKGSVAKEPVVYDDDDM